MANILLKENDLVDRWDVTISTLQQWRWSGAGPEYIKIGRKIKYRLADVEDFENARLSKSTSTYKSNNREKQDQGKPSRR